MSFVDPRHPPYLIGDNWRYLARAANVETDVLIPESPIDPRPDLASSPEHPDRTDDPEFPYTKPEEQQFMEGLSQSAATTFNYMADGSVVVTGEMPNQFVVVESNPKLSEGIAPPDSGFKPLEHAPVVPTAPRREKTLSDYYGVFGPPKRRS